MDHAHFNQSDGSLLLYVNGKKVVVENPDPEDTLLLFLREKMRLTGTKLGCAEGGCGACTVMVSKYDRRSDTITHMSANACLAPLVSLHGQAITTVEGIGSTRTRLHAVQERLALSHGSQCGFCTPGIVMSMYALLRNKPLPSQHDLESAFDGNLCRCTGYRPILQAFKTFTAEGCPMGEKCCKNQNNNSCGPPEDLTKDCNDSTQDLIFPPELKLVDFKEYKLFRGERVVWHQPVILNHLLELKKQYPNAKLVCGNTEIGVEVKLKNQLYPVLISTSHVPELCEIQITDDGVWFGGSVTLAQLGETLTKQVEILPAYKTRIYSEVINMLKWFAGHQIRNVSSIAGNFMTASPISDLNPLYLAARSTIRVQSSDRGVREIKLDEQFFISYRKIAVAEDEVFISL